ncbi:MAG: DNA recombination/repair protein RecA [Chloroflexota bacterium]
MCTSDSDAFPQFQQPAPARVTSSGSLKLDLALGTGGIPSASFVEIFGPEASGKTSLCLHTIVEAQKAGGVCAYIDCDRSLDAHWSARCGVDQKQLIISQPDNAEQTLAITESLATSGALTIIVIDSLSGLTPQSVLESGLENPLEISSAPLLSRTLRRLSGAIQRNGTTIIFTNQLPSRSRSAVYHNLARDPARLALKLFAALRLKLSISGPILEKDQVIGSRIQVKIVKNQKKPCFQFAELDIMYRDGILKTGDIFDLGSQLGLIQQQGLMNAFKDIPLGEDRRAALDILKRNPGVSAEIEQIIRQRLLGQVQAVTGDKSLPR